MMIPDILYKHPRARIDEAAVTELLDFAFATGRAADPLDAHMAVAVEEDGFDAACFAEDLYLRDLLENCLVPAFGRETPLNTEAFYRRLCAPPRDKDTVLVRQGVLKELTRDPRATAWFRRLYQTLRRLVWAFDTSSFAVKLDLTEFRMSVVAAFLDVVVAMLPFAGCRSVLSRIAEAAADIGNDDAYLELTSLVRYAESLATVDVRVRVGARGDLQAFSIVSLQEQTENRHYRDPLRRFWDKTRLWFRGYPFSDSALVGALVEDVFRRLGPRIASMVELLGQVEFYLFGLGFRDACARKGLPVCLPDFGTEAPEWVDLHNPLLHRGNGQPVPCDLRPTRPDEVTLVTGPNSGGKTRLLQAVGIAQLMGQNGLFVAAGKARLRMVSGLYASLREQDAVDAPEGRLGQELMRIHDMFQKSPYGSMLLLDELCSGTNPGEGAEIMSLVFEMLGGLHAQAYITTHFLDFVRELAAKKPFANLAFLTVVTRENGAPTYQFAPGVATTSLARRIAQRLGVSREHLQTLIEEKAARARRLSA